MGSELGYQVNSRKVTMRPADLTPDEALKVRAFIKENMPKGMYYEDSEHDPLDCRWEGGEIVFSDDSRGPRSTSWNYAGIEATEGIYSLFGWGDIGKETESLINKAADYAAEITGRDILIDRF